MEAGRCCNAMSPWAWPYSSLHRLKLSASTKSTQRRIECAPILQARERIGCGHRDERRRRRRRQSAFRRGASMTRTRLHTNAKPSYFGNHRCGHSFSHSVDCSTSCSCRAQRPHSENACHGSTTTMTSKPQPAIARIWRGRTRPEVADEYEAYNRAEGVPSASSSCERTATTRPGSRPSPTGPTWNR